MKVIVNGVERDLAEGTSLGALLAALGIRRETVVVERNGRIVERDVYDAADLTAADRLEIVRFVGGG